ncbi:O-antigen ligase family protein [Bacillus sp. B15-48]|uniref:O-antigen ligase family protein n=1 Tax=Bacillus sp. B15-48 TaxID=1548601 RepID=UPI00193F0279|nr:O-antigen ligase family protein [Bacillus sp. B15-48]MBM4762697.1 hypothetical protein [Bacillus sp. B15-48]
MSKLNNVTLFILSLAPLGYIIGGALPESLEFTLLIYMGLYLIAAYKIFIVKQDTIYVSKIDLVFYLLVCLSFISVLFSNNQIQGIIKSLKFIFLGLGLTFFCRLFIRSREDLEKLFRYLLLGSVLTEYVVLIDYFLSAEETIRYLAFEVVIPIPLSLLGATTTAITLIFYFYNKIKFRYFVLALIPSISMMTIAASKGPVVSLIITTILMYPVFYRKLKVKHILMLPVFVFLITRIDFINESMNNLWFRFSNTEDDLSTTIRVSLYEGALEKFYENPLFGVGMGNLEYYPHNIFIETLAENGIIFTGIVVMLFIIFLRRFVFYLLERKYDFLESVIISLLSISLVSLMFSFTYVDHKYLFLSVGLLVVYDRVKKERLTKYWKL